MATSHPLMTRIAARLKGEIPADELEALRGAGSQVYDAYVTAESARKQLAAAGTDLWSPAGHDPRPRLITLWRGFACQQLGEAFLDADYAADPRTRGFVPPVTARQAEAYFTEVELMLHDLARAEDPSWRPSGVPSRLPAWVDVEPCPQAHLEAMLKACSVIAMHAELAVADLEQLGAAAHQREHAKLKALLAGVLADADYAATLYSGLHGTASQEMHERAERTVKRAVEGAYLIGQLAAMPGLTAAVPAPERRLPRPQEAGFDMWCLTSPRTRADWKRDPAAVRAIEMLWRYDPDPEATLAIQGEIDAAAERGDVRITGQGNYFCCPWSAIYQAVNPVTLGGQRVRRGKTFTFDVSGEEMAEGGAFKREVLVADFQPTTKVDYCNPEEGGHHDDDD